MRPETVELLVWTIGAAFVMMNAAALFYARRIALALGRVAGVEVSAEQLANVDMFVSKAITYVEERVNQYVKGLVATGPTSAAEKQTLAVATARELAPDDLKQFSNAALAKLVDAKVNEMRTEAQRNSFLPPKFPSSLPPPTNAARAIAERPFSPAADTARATPVPPLRGGGLR